MEAQRMDCDERFSLSEPIVEEQGDFMAWMD
jgi:hypothetical protein